MSGLVPELKSVSPKAQVLSHYQNKTVIAEVLTTESFHPLLEEWIVSIPIFFWKKWVRLKNFLFIFYCIITNYHKLSDSKQHLCIVSQFYGSGIWTQLSWVLCSGFHKAAIMVLAGAKTSSGAQGPLLIWCGCKQNSFSHCSRTLGSFSFNPSRKDGLTFSGQFFQECSRTSFTKVKPAQRNLSFDFNAKLTDSRPYCQL